MLKPIWHIIDFIYSMKLMPFVFSMCLLISLRSAAQQPVNDTLIPKQHLDDTLQYEPKLQGGALIDTIHTGDKQFKHQPVHPQDSSAIKKDSVFVPRKK
jgi:hypothetical protein